MEFDAQKYPSSPGVYIMKDARGGVLYVGKAIDLRKRVKNYFGREARERYQIKFLMEKVEAIDLVETKTDKEAFLLEHKLIQRYKPRYNIAQKDDKTFIRVKITSNHPYPAIMLTRRIKKDGADYFGPYVSAFTAREMVDHAVKFCRLRTCSDREFANRSRPCLQYDIGRCSAPCVGLVSKDDYAAQVEDAVLFLKGRRRELFKHLKERMSKASADMKYEEAAYYRDLIKGIRKLLEKQSVVRPDEEFVLKKVLDDEDSETIYEMVAGALAKKLHLDGTPHVIECVDTSNIQGSAAVGAVVSFISGRPSKNRYRLFNIKMAKTVSDLDMMREVLSRHFFHEDSPRPELLLVDGGRGQLNIALKVLKELNVVGVSVVAVAKIGASHRKGTDIAQVFLPNRINPVKFKKGDPSLLYLIRIRDEAHRFVIGHHRRRRAKSMMNDQ